MQTPARLVHPLRRGTARTRQSVYRGSIGVAALASRRLNLWISPMILNVFHSRAVTRSHEIPRTILSCCSDSRTAEELIGWKYVHDTRRSGAVRGDQSLTTRLHIPGCSPNH